MFMGERRLSSVSGLLIFVICKVAFKRTSPRRHINSFYGSEEKLVLHREIW